ncbi:ABC transporter ATP-binding protein [uncultured Anaerococcus sp.]|uniref:ABC transporter ATP-binding protein n=1 Tax=uncultured Anaerococcus sp. TaxID=293428 RepID=UPI002805CCE2|nr:ABC transporter ATP-binding protein [uncultured Anaerococcus sp.]
MFKIISMSYRYLKKYKYKLLIYYFLTLTMSTISIIYPRIIGEFTDVLVDKNMSGLYKYILYFTIFNLINLLFTYISGKLYIYIQSQSAYEFNKDINIHVWNIPLLESSKYDCAYLADRINNDTNSIVIFSINVIQTVCSTIISVIVSSMFMIKLDKTIFLIAVIASVLYSTIYILLRKKIYRINRLLMDSKSRFTSRIYEQLVNIRSVKIHGAYNKNERNLDKSFHDLFSNTLSAYNLNYFYSFFDDFISQVSSIIFFIYGGVSVIKGNISLGQYVSLNSYLMVLMSSSAALFSLAKEIKLAKVSYDRIYELTKIEEEINESIKLKEIDNIELNLTFSYNQNAKVFQYKTNLEKGKIYKISGENGSGKSTLLDNIVALYMDTYEGKITYNDIDIKKLDIKYIRKNMISYIEQKVDVSNINEVNRLNPKEASEIILDNKLNDLMEISHNRIIYNKSFDKISGGQKRKIQIYSEILKNAGLVILDEPANDLDRESIDCLKKTLKKMSNNKTTIIVDHTNYFDDIIDEIIHI